jgi:asparagine synthase (glutamine-hydrolysing)
MAGLRSPWIMPQRNTIPYLEHLESRERVGSSQRYGYLFENEKRKMWIAEPHVQMYLDCISKALPALE